MSGGSVRRILLLSPGAGGADGISTLTRQYVHALARIAAKAGATLEVWSLDDAAAPPGLPAGLHMRCASGRRARFGLLGLIAPAVDRHTLVVVLHAHLLPVALPLVARGARLVPVLIGVEVWGPLRWLVRLALRRAWRVLSISRATRSRFLAAHPEFSGAGITVCLPEAPPPVTPGPQPAGFPGPYALIVGRMAASERYKGHDVLIDVWPRVRASVPEATLVIAGTGDDVGRLRAKSGDGIVFAGRLPADRLAAAYRDATVFAMPSTGEGFGFVFLEAMQAGAACLAAPGAAEEILEDGVSGVIVDPGSPDRLTAALVRLFTDAPWRERLVSGGRKVMADRFGPGGLAERLGAGLDLPA